MNPAIESQFNPRTTVPDVGIYTSRGDKLSAEARTHYKFEADVRYGNGPLANLDYFPAQTAGRPLVVFLHGGYWRARDKKDYSFVVNGLQSADCSVVVMNYDLCPTVKLSEIVLQVKEGLVWLAAQAERWGFDPKQIYVSGHSAGAHLLAAVLAQTGETYQLPAGMIKKAYLLSGVYDVEPVLEISVNEEIRLLPEEVHAMSPLRFAFHPETSYEILVGGGEPRDWIRESSRFAEHLKKQGCAVFYQAVRDLNHYSLMFEFETPEGFISKRIRQDIEAS
jgi:arylformamidase